MPSSLLQQPQATSSPSAISGSSSSLAELTLSAVTQRLEDIGSSLQGQGLEAIQALLEALEDGLTGSLPKAYHLSAIDPGVGKTLSVAAFLRTWKAHGFNPASSVLIGVSRLEEVRAYLRESELEHDDVAVLTSVEDLNVLGVPQEDYGTARVMFTTQQMIERRTRGRTFAEVTEFHFDGRPRALRIWDESLVPAQSLVVGVDELARLPGVLNRKAPELAKVARSLLNSVLTAEDGARIVIPRELGHLPRPPATGSTVSDTWGNVGRLAGQEVVAIHHNTGNTQLAGSSPPLPEDFAPVVILDASGRVRSTYEVWERELGTLKRLPAAANDYDRLRVHLWERPVGQSSFQLPGTLIEVVDAVAEAINDDPTTDHWLVVSYKRHPIEEALCAAVNEDARLRLHFLTWGMHHGTNDFRHCRKIVLIGHLNYGPAGYTALASAAGHLAPQDPQAAERDLKDGEYRHGYLQALARASVRLSRNGEAGVCTAYVIASPAVGAEELLSETFPGCTVEPWQPSLEKTQGLAAGLIALLEKAAYDRLPSVTKRELAAALGVTGPNLSRLLKHRRVTSYIERKHLKVSRYEISGWTRFEPWEGEGFTIGDLDVM